MMLSLQTLNERLAGDSRGVYIAQFIVMYLCERPSAFALSTHRGADRVAWCRVLGVDLSKGAPAWAKPTTIAERFWCTREEFIEAMTELHGKDLMVRVLIALEET